jgi:hypothetical protein
LQLCVPPVATGTDSYRLRATRAAKKGTAA